MSDALQMLKRLAPPVAPVEVGPPPATPSTIGSASFDQLLLLSASGRVSSERSIRVEAALQEPLEAAQLQRLADAADLAERHGARRALMLLDNRALVLEISARSITRELEADKTDTIHAVDTAVQVGSGCHGSVVSLTPAMLGSHPPASSGAMARRSHPSGIA